MKRTVVAVLLALTLAVSLGASTALAVGHPQAIVVAPGAGAFLNDGGDGRPVIFILHPRGGVVKPPPVIPPGR